MDVGIRTHGNQRVKTIVLHAMGEFIDADPDDFYAPYFLASLNLGAHYFVSPSGVIVRAAKPDETCWHAKGHNTDSVGIEILVPGLHTYETFLAALNEGDPFSDAQYDAVRGLVADLKRGNPDFKTLTTHAALDPGRKLDPGPHFDIARVA